MAAVRPRAGEAAQAESTTPKVALSPWEPRTPFRLGQAAWVRAQPTLLANQGRRPRLVLSQLQAVAAVAAVTASGPPAPLEDKPAAQAEVEQADMWGQPLAERELPDKAMRAAQEVTLHTTPGPSAAAEVAAQAVSVRHSAPTPGVSGVQGSPTH